MTADQFFWLLARVTGLSSYATLSIALVTGIALRTAVLDWLAANRALRSLHEFTTVLWIPLAALHVLSLLLDTTARVGVIDVVVPFHSSYGTLAIGVGALFDTAIATATETMATLRTSSSSYQPMADYSDNVKLVYSSKNQLAAALQLAAELIVTGTGVKLLHVTLGGFDTHYTELSRHDDLMGYLDSAVSAFYQDLAAHHMADKVLIATWSEFGRRPRENASGGTDHGAAAPLMLIGDPVRGGLFGEEPSLTSLDDTGNLKYAVDFRSVYQEILSGHLGADSGQILGSAFERVPFLKAPVAV